MYCSTKPILCRRNGAEFTTISRFLNTVDAAFVGLDGNTYLFSGDQYISYVTPEDGAYTDLIAEELPQAIKERWGGLTHVALAFVEGNNTYLFEKPDKEGKFRYVRYSGRDYSQPDEGFPQTDDLGFWEIPAPYVEEGFQGVDAVLMEGDSMFLLYRDRFLQFNIEEQVWTAPMPLDRIWRSLPMEEDDFQHIKTAFAGPDGAVHFFSDHYYVRHKDYASTTLIPINEFWGLVANNFSHPALPSKVDAAFVWQNETTYLFSGNQYVRYSGTKYNYVDPGYPKEIAKNLRKETAFKQLPESFEELMLDLQKKGETIFIDAIVSNHDKVFIFIGKDCHIISQHPTYTGDISQFGSVKNRIHEGNRIDAAFVNGSGQVFLFSRDQYVRYSDLPYQYVDDGYPKTISEGLPQEEGMQHIPEEFHHDLDAAFNGKDGNAYLFKGKYFYHSAEQAVHPVKDHWGKITNIFLSNPEDTSIDAAFVAPKGQLYVFKGEQYIRYQTPGQEFVDEGFPKPIKDAWGNMPVHFEAGIDGGFVFENKTYFVKGEEYIRYSDWEYAYVDNMYPQPFTYRWGHRNDLLLSDLQAISRYNYLQKNYSSEDHTITDLLHAGKGYLEDPYQTLSEIFGWEVEEVRWLKRSNAFLNSDTQKDVNLRLELLIRMYDILELTRKIGIDASTLYTQVWRNLYTETGNPQEAASSLISELGMSLSEQDWSVLSGQIHNALNQVKRDALVGYTIAQDDNVQDARELYEKLLIDVQMGSCAKTSRIKEAIAAVQLYLHRFFLNLEQQEQRGGADIQIREKLKERWKWLKSYRVWEANRKVFLYPENYIRPELRDTKTPVFKTFEDNLLQSEVSEVAVQRVYKTYLDEYTEVSRLNIAGGYAYDEPGSAGQVKSLILFGRTKTEPRTYYYRQARFPQGAAIWEPWFPVNVQIDVEKVYPVFAFDRIFVFWAKVETLQEPTEETQLTVIANGNNQTVKNNNSAQYVIKIHFAFQDLNKEWVQAQTLAGEIRDVKEIVEIDLFVENSDKLNLPGKVGKHENIVINCSFRQIGDDATSNEAFVLTPELYTERTDKPQVQNRGKAIFNSLFEEPEIADAKMTMLNSTEKSAEVPWFSFDYKGGSFLCKPAIPQLGNKAWPQDLLDNPSFPAWSKIDAAFYGPDGHAYFFNNEKQVFVRSDQFADEISIQERWKLSTVDSAYVRDDKLFLIGNGQFLRYSISETEIHETPDEGYPKTFILPGSLNRIEAAVAINHEDRYMIYLMGDKGIMKYTRSETELFDEGKFLKGRIDAVLRDLGYEGQINNFMRTKPRAAYYRADQKKVYFVTSFPFLFRRDRYMVIYFDLNTKK